jgi:hypothetical protein
VRRADNLCHFYLPLNHLVLKGTVLSCNGVANLLFLNVMPCITM